jgi:hypothetical protein
MRQISMRDKNATLQQARRDDIRVASILRDYSPEWILRDGTRSADPSALSWAEEAGALTFARLAESVRPAIVNGAPGIVSWLPGGRPLAVMGFTVTRGKIVEIDILADPVRLGQIDLKVPED